MADDHPKSKFIEHLININKLDEYDLAHFVFFTGMMFRSMEKWWDGGGKRRVPHEGLDLCFFVNTRNDKFRLDETIKVPMMYDGRIAHVMDDYLGKTVIAKHQTVDKPQSSFLTIYGHVDPDDNLQVGVELNEGEVLASIAGIDNRQTSLLPHLHISLARPDMLPPSDRLTWEKLNKIDRSVFIDPVDCLCTNYTIMEYDKTVDLSKTFRKCSQLAMAV
jgi:hypothetical protein